MQDQMITRGSCPKLAVVALLCYSWNKNFIDLNLDRMLNSASPLRLVFILENCMSSAEFLAENRDLIH